MAHIPEDQDLNPHRLENLKSRIRYQVTETRTQSVAGCQKYYVKN
jgi:hypothetical protein